MTARRSSSAANFGDQGVDVSLASGAGVLTARLFAGAERGRGANRYARMSCVGSVPMAGMLCVRSDMWGAPASPTRSALASEGMPSVLLLFLFRAIVVRARWCGPVVAEINELPYDGGQVVGRIGLFVLIA